MKDQELESRPLVDRTGESGTGISDGQRLHETGNTSIVGVVTTDLVRASAPPRPRSTTSPRRDVKPGHQRRAAALEAPAPVDDWDDDDPELAETLADDQDGWDVPVESRSRGRRAPIDPQATSRRADRRAVEWRATGSGWSRALQPHRGWVAWVAAASRDAVRIRVALLALAVGLIPLLVAAADIAGQGWDGWPARVGWVALAVGTIPGGWVLSRVMGLPLVSRLDGTRRWDVTRQGSQLGAMTAGTILACGVAALWAGPVTGSRAQLVTVAVPSLVGLAGLTGWIVRVTSRGAEAWRAHARRAMGIADADDPAAVLRARWREGVGRGGKGIPTALAGSRVSHPIRFLSGGGWQAPVRIKVESAGWLDLTKDAARNAIAKQEGASADLVFVAPHRAGASHATVTVYRKDPLRPVQSWAPAIAEDGAVVVATLADGTPVRAHVHRGTWGATHSLIVGMTGSGKGSVGAVLGAAAAISGRCSVLLLDAGDGDSVPQLAECGVVDWVGEGFDEVMRGLRAMDAVLDARRAGKVAKRDWDATTPLVVAVLPEVSLLLGDKQYGEEATEIVKRVVRLGRKYGIGLHMDTQAFNAEEWGDTTIRAQLTNLFALKINDATVRSQVARQFPGTDLLVPDRPWPTEGYAWVRAQGGSNSPLPARIHWVDKAAVREIQRLRRDITVQHPAELVSALRWEA